jgi:hypothetical protein
VDPIIPTSPDLNILVSLQYPAITRSKYCSRIFYLAYLYAWEKRNIYRLLVGEPEGKRPLGRPRRRWIDNIKMDLLEIELSVVDWIRLAKDSYRWRVVGNAVINFRVR